MADATLDELAGMVADLVEIEAITAVEGVAILRDATCGLDRGTCLRLLLVELDRRERDAARRDAAAEQAMRDTDGPWW